MKIDGNREWELLKKIGFTRTAGSAEELRAAEIIRDECEAMGVPAVMELFRIEEGVVHKARLEILEPYHQEYAVTGYKCAENTPPQGITAEFLYAEDALDVNLLEARGKIVLVNGYLRVPLFRSLVKAGAAAVITMEGELRDCREETDLSTRKLRRAPRTFGNLPVVHTRVADAMDMVMRGASRARLVLEGETVELTSHNVVAVLPGTEKPEEIISFGTHYDSVDYSAGVYDNAAGSVINLEILRYFAENPPKRTVKFMWYGSEEIGLEGSWAYVKAHKEELERHVLMINVDVGGPVLGSDKAVVTGEEKLANYLDYFMKMNGYAVGVCQGIYSSDSIPFADSGVPGVNFSRDGAKGAAYIHSRFDTPDFLWAPVLEKTTVPVLGFAKAMVGAAVFPAERKIPQNITEEVEKYLYKKELSEAAT